MCSRNGKPIEICDLPLPSRFSFTRTSVSFVLRRTSARRSRLLICDFMQRSQQSIVFFRSAHTETKVVVQEWISAHIPDEDVALEQLVEHPLYLCGRPNHHKVGAGF